MNVIPQAATDRVVRALGPLARGLARSGVTPNVMAAIGALVTAGSAAAFGCGRIRLGGGLLLAGGLCSLLGGEVARQGQRLTTVGALYQSVLDRVGESLLFGGIAFYFLRGGAPEGWVELAVGLAIAALATSLLAAYLPARAESLGLQPRAGGRGGLASPGVGGPIRVLGALTLAAGAGRDGWLLFWMVAALSLAAAVTVVHGGIHAGRTTGRTPAESPPRKRDTLPGHAPVRRREQ